MGNASSRGSRNPNEHLRSVIRRATSVTLQALWGNTEITREVDAAAVQALVHNLQVDDPGGEAYDAYAHCFCKTEYAIRFYRRSTLLAELSIQHGTQLRWSKEWKGDPSLSSESRAFVHRWLSDRGVRGPQTTYEIGVVTIARENRKDELAIERMPDALRDAFTGKGTGPSTAGEDDYEESNTSTLACATFAAAVKIGMPPVAVATLMLRAVGVSNAWSGSGHMECTALDCLSSLDKSVLCAAVEAAILGEDRFTRRGAARIIVKSDGPRGIYTKAGDGLPADWAPERLTEMRLSVLGVLQEARNPGLRRRVAQLLQAWSATLPDSESNSRLVALIRDPDENVARVAALAVPHLPSTAASTTPLLLDLAAGRPLQPVALAPVPPDEDFDPAEHYYVDQVAEGASRAEVAALALGLAGHQPARPIVESLLITPAGAPSDYAAVALALLGDAGRLEPRHFNSEAVSDELAQGALTAAIRSSTRRDLNLLTGFKARYQIDQSQAEKDIVQRVAAALAEKRAPSAAELAGATSFAALGLWLAAHGAELEAGAPPASAPR